jgi:hypothetical protein
MASPYFFAPVLNLFLVFVYSFHDFAAIQSPLGLVYSRIILASLRKESRSLRSLN